MAGQAGVVLSGCGFLDGAEIHESVLTLYFLQKAGIDYRCFAPDRDQFHVVDHLTGEPTDGTRNVLAESARIARGEIAPLGEARMAELDALVLPGGYGAAKNLSNFAVEGPSCTLEPDMLRLVGEAVQQGKPIAAICISPAVVAAALKSLGRGATLTIGSDADTAAALEELGCRHRRCAVDEVAVDEDLRIVSTPAYMLGPGPAEVGAGIEKAVARLAAWLR